MAKLIAGEVAGLGHRGRRLRRGEDNKKKIIRMWRSGVYSKRGSRQVQLAKA